MKLFVNILGIIVLTLISVGYLSFIADLVHQRYALVVNVILFPILLGIIGAWIIQAPMQIKLILLLIIPIVHILHFGGDPAKPGLENLVAIVEAVCIWVGVFIFYLMKKILNI